MLRKSDLTDAEHAERAKLHYALQSIPKGMSLEVVDMFHDIEGKYYRFRKGGNTMKREDYISDETVVKRAKEAVRLEIEKNKALGVPVVIYDRKSQIIYQENDDGTRTEIGRKMRKGRYSERVSKEA